MRVRFTTIVGTPVYEETNPEPLGTIGGIVIQPDTGAIEGFVVQVRGFLGKQNLMLSPLDILHWGTRILVRSSDSLVPPEDLLRLQQLFENPRPVLWQYIQTLSGKKLGVCADVQFDTKHFRVEWLFPRRFFVWGIPVPVSQIQEVKKEAIIIKDQEVTMKEDQGETEKTPIIPVMPEAV